MRSLVSIILFSLLLSCNNEIKTPKIKSPESAIGSKENPQERLDYESIQLKNPKSGIIPIDIEKRERIFIRKLQDENHRNRRLSQRNWVSLGPSNIGGRTRAFAQDIENSDHLVVGGVSGGIFGSYDKGISWTKKSKSNQIFSITCLVQDKRSGNTHRWYAGTGELIGNSAREGGAPYRGDGLFFSVDNGESWTEMSSTNRLSPHRFVSSFQYTWNIAVNNNNTINDELWVAAFGGILKTTDGGETWETALGVDLLSFADDADLNNVAAPYHTDVFLDKNGGIWATLGNATADDYGYNGGIFFSKNGKDFFEITPRTLSSQTQRTIIAANANHTKFYFYTQSEDIVQLHRFDVSGFFENNVVGTWSDLSNNLPSDEDLGAIDTQGSYNMALQIDPENDQIIWIGGTNLYRNSEGFEGKNSTKIVGGYHPGEQGELYPGHHPDQHGLFFDINDFNILFSIHDGGVSVSFQSQNDSVKWQSVNNQYVSSQFYTLAIAHEGGENFMIGGLQDNGTNLFSGNDIWQRVIGGDGGYTAITPDQQFYYVSFQNSQIYQLQLNSDYSIRYFARVDPEGGGESIQAPYLFINPYILDPINPHKMYLAGGDRIWINDNLSQIPVFSQKKTSINWRSLDRTKTFKTSGNTVTAYNGQISALEVSHSPSHVLYYGTSLGRLYRLDSPDVVTQDPKRLTSNSFPIDAYIVRIAVAPDDGNKLLVIFSNYEVRSIFYSENGGETFTHVGGNLEENEDGSGAGPSIRWADIILTEYGYEYMVLTSSGIFSTDVLDGSNTNWSKEGEEIIGNAVSRMGAIRHSDGTYAVATHGNGVFQTTIEDIKEFEQPIVQSDEIIVTASPVPFSDKVTISYTLPRSGIVKLTIYNYEGKIIRKMFETWQFKGENKAFWDGKLTNSEPVNNGLYMFQLQYEGKVIFGKLILSQ